LLKRNRTERPTDDGPPRLLIVDDNADAAHVLAKILRAAGYEVAEVADQQTTVSMLTAAPGPIAGVVASFTTTGTSAGLRLLDAIRNHSEATVSSLRYLLVSDNPRQQLYGLQAGADAIIVRPYASVDLVEAVGEMVARDDEERVAYRRKLIGALKAEGAEPVAAASVTPTFF